MARDERMPHEERVMGQADVTTDTGAGAELVPSARPLRLFLIPLLIVLLLVWVWTKVHLPSYENTDPQQLVRDIAKLDDDSWLKAYALSRLLADTNDTNLGTDRALAREVSGSLAAELENEHPSAAHVQLRVFLCRALGEFRLDEGLAILAEVASSRPGAVPDVRCAALESIAVLADRIGSSEVRKYPGVLDAVINASRVSGMAMPPQMRNKLRSTAAFTLGVLGGRRAASRLADMTNDGNPDTRFNAAVGLARAGDPRAVPILLEMLDPTSQAVVEGETDVAAVRLKRSLVVVNAVRAVVRLAEENPACDLKALQDAVQRVAESTQLSSRVRRDARDALRQLDAVANQSPQHD